MADAAPCLHCGDPCPPMKLRGGREGKRSFCSRGCRDGWWLYRRSAENLDRLEGTVESQAAEIARLQGVLAHPLIQATISMNRLQFPEIEGANND